jgi:thiol-disulfide isomerase/thioredoxin
MGIVDKLRDSVSLRNGIVILLVIVFVMVASYVYMTYFKKNNNEYVTNQEFEQTAETDEAEVIMFYTDWCPHCKKAKPFWERVKNEYDGTVVNGVKIHFKEYNRDHNEALAEKYEVKGVPTIFTLQGEKMVIYDARVTYDSLVEFLKSSL